jgi:hypothetical protein
MISIMNQARRPASETHHVGFESRGNRYARKRTVDGKRIVSSEPAKRCVDDEVPGADDGTDGDEPLARRYTYTPAKLSTHSGLK